MELYFENKSHKTKPEGNINSFKNFRPVNVGIQELFEAVTQGVSIHCEVQAVGATGFKNDTAVSTYILGIDCDKTKRTPQEFVEYCKTNFYQPNMWYYTFSQGKDDFNHFRALWCLDEPMSKTIFDNTIENFQNLFTEFNADKSTKNITRLWYGGLLGGQIVTEEYYTVTDFAFLNYAVKHERGMSPSKSCNGKKDGTDTLKEKLPRAEAVNVPDNWEILLLENFELYKKWANQEYMPYNQRLRLFMNLGELKKNDGKNQVNLYDEIIAYYNPDVWAGHTCTPEQIKSMLKERTLSALPINCKQYKSRITMGQFFRGLKDGKFSFELINDKSNALTLKELDEMMDKEVPILIESDEPIYYIISQCGAGKSEQLYRWIAQQDLRNKKIIVAQGEHALLDETYERLANMRQDFTAGIYRVGKGYYNESDYAYMAIGLSPSYHSENKTRNQILAMLRDENAKGCFLMTHACLVKSGTYFKGVDYIFVDENCEECMVDRIRVTDEQLREMKNFVNETNKDKIQAIRDREYVFNEEFDFSELKQIISEDLINNIESYLCLKSKYIVSGLFRIMEDTKGYINSQGEPQIKLESQFLINAKNSGTKVRIFTATSLKESIDSGSLCKVYSFPFAQNRGTIYQYLGHSGAKGMKCDNVNSLINYVEEKLGDKAKQMPVISFMDSAEIWQSRGYQVLTTDGNEYNGTSVPLHIKNSRGLDILKGRKIIVAGKFDYPQFHYFDRFAELHPGVKELPSFSNQIIKLYGREFNIWLCNDPKVREEQMENLQYSATQAVGRARALREEGAEVHVFCNYPLEEADKFMY